MTNDKNILIKNIYYMLAYAFQVLKRNNYANIASEKFEHIEDLFAEILSRGISYQLKQGLYREYVPKTESLPTMRGKIDITKTIKHRIQCQQILSCEFDELSENNIFNQILKTTISILLQEKIVAKERKNKLKKVLPFFVNINTIEPSIVKWNTLDFQRNNQTYKMLMNICYFILEGLLQTTENGKYHMATFSDEYMHRLYEKFVLEYYKTEHPELKASTSRIKWNIDYQSDNKALELLPCMQSDIMLEYNGRTLIIDTKYYSQTMQKQYNKQTLHSNNLYQIFTYVKNYDIQNSSNVAGMLLYAKTNEEITPDLETSICGNRIYVKTLDLYTDFKNIASQLDEIISYIKIH